jgi:quercetin dioxygenase-like cupin family protein
MDQIDLCTMEFEAEGFGSGRKMLEPGEVVDAHNSGGSREIIYCLAGKIMVHREGHPTVTLAAGQMTYVPPRTEHDVRNASDRLASYLFVFAKECVSESTTHER